MHDDSHGPGTDLTAVDRKLDTFHHNYQNQLADQEASMARITKYASQLSDGKYKYKSEWRACNRVYGSNCSYCHSDFC